MRIIRHISDIARYMRRIFRLCILSASAWPSLILTLYDDDDDDDDDDGMMMPMMMMMVMTIIKMMGVMIRMNLGSSGAWNGSASQKFHYIQLISFPSNALQCTLHFTTNDDTIIHFFTPMYLCALWDSSLRHKIVLVNIQLTNYSGWVGQYLGQYLGR